MNCWTYRIRGTIAVVIGLGVGIGGTVAYNTNPNKVDLIIMLSGWVVLIVGVMLLISSFRQYDVQM